MPAYFVPPVTYTVPTTVPGRHPGNVLFRHFGGRAEGVTVYLMPDGTITQTDPYSDLEAKRVFHGGHIHEVSDAEAALLTAAGYTVSTIVAPASAYPSTTLYPGEFYPSDVGSPIYPSDPGYPYVPPPAEPAVTYYPAPVLFPTPLLYPRES